MRGYRPSKDPKGGNVFTSDVTDVPEYWNWRLQGKLLLSCENLLNQICACNWPQQAHAWFKLVNEKLVYAYMFVVWNTGMDP